MTAITHISEVDNPMIGIKSRKTEARHTQRYSNRIALDRGIIGTFGVLQDELQKCKLSLQFTTGAGGYSHEHLKSLGELLPIYILILILLIIDVFINTNIFKGITLNLFRFYN